MTPRTDRDAWLTASDEVLSSQCTLDFHKSSGHGGQKVNKTSSAVRVVHSPSGVSAVSAESRSQHENRKHAFSLLKMSIAFEVRCEPEAGFDPSAPEVSMRNEKYPLWTANVLDVFSACGCDPKKSGAFCGISTSKFVKILYRDPSLWREVQAMRRAAGLAPLISPEKK